MRRCFGLPRRSKLILQEMVRRSTLGVRATSVLRSWTLILLSQRLTLELSKFTGRLVL